jgi:hypothetical protein
MASWAGAMSGNPGIRNAADPIKMIPIVRDPSGLCLPSVVCGVVFKEAE